MASATDRPHVTVVGSYAVGLTLRTARFPGPGETVLGGDFDQGPGGKGSNQAIQAARLGASVELVASIGSDSFGDDAVALYEREGIGVRFLRRSADRNTGVGFIVLSEEGENFIVLDPGANEELSTAWVEHAFRAIGGTGAVLAQLEIPLDAALRAMELGREAGAATILNPAPARPMPTAGLEAIDVLTPNALELRVALGVPDDAEASEHELCTMALERGVGAVVMTRGRRGAFVVDAKGAFEIPAVPIRPVDSTGAGDAFTGCLGVELAAGRSLRDAVELAVVAGAHACLRLGVVPGLGTRSELDALRARFETPAKP